MLTQELVASEIERLTISYRCTMQQMQRDLEAALSRLGSDGNGVSNHLGHNLGSSASELQMVAGQIETMQAVGRSL